MGAVIDFPLRDAAYSSRRPVASATAGQVNGQVSAQIVILPVIRIERYEEQPRGYFKTGRSDQTRKRRRRASRS